MGNLSVRNYLLRIVALIIIDAFGLQLVIGIGTNLSVPLAIGIFIATFLINVVFLVERLYPWRWTSPGLLLMALLVLYPLLTTVYISFTNYGDGHSITKQQVLDHFLKDPDFAYYQPKDAVTYKYTAFLPPNAPSQPSANDFVLWLIAPNGKAYVGSQQKGLVDEASAEATFGRIGTKDSSGIPASIGDDKRVESVRMFSLLSSGLKNLVINANGLLIRTSGVSNAPAKIVKYKYDESAGTLTDNETGKVYHEERGQFVSNDGGTRQALDPGWPAVIGVDNFLRAFTDPNIRDPFIRVFVWTVAFALISVFSTFALGLMFALLLNSPTLPMRGIFRTLLVIPYTIPGFISALVWAGFFNTSLGPINNFLSATLGIRPEWLQDPTLAKAAILLINLWLGYPYMMLINMGALQSIPADIYEAAVIDGANPFQQFWSVTLPLLLVAVGPLLIGSFAFNFNNFALIELVTKGGPPMSAITVAGNTDILISYTYRIAFGSSKGIDYGFASAVTLFIFAIVAGVTIINFRINRQLESVSENV